MPLPQPVPGLVIRYAYLWHRKLIAGQAEGEKDRPCAVVLNQEAKGDDKLVTVAAITHTRPKQKTDGLLIPPATKARLGLDDEPAWVIVREVNRFIWPGPDLRPVSNTQWTYGLLPAKFLRLVQAAIYRHASTRRLKQVPRTD